MMGMKIDPTEIRSIKSNMPVTITFNDGSALTAYSFILEDAECDVARDNNILAGGTSHE